jgi:glycerol-3-phosphate dehydrogenase
VTDVLLRRTRLGLLDARAVCPEGAEPPRAVAEVLGGELGWDDDRIAREVADWHEQAAAEGLDVSSLEPAPAS